MTASTPVLLSWVHLGTLFLGEGRPSKEKALLVIYKMVAWEWKIGAEKA